ncbi:MAG: beta-propeller fold lactonase family protein [Burkholderiales bacterium]|nr:beta-propeller fold lactonase family protein [Anaerolineae bacterium]
MLDGAVQLSLEGNRSGAYLLVANQDSDNVVTFRVDSESGRLTATGQITSVPSPVCVKVVD